MEALRDILRTFRPVGGETLRVAGTGAEPFAAGDPRALRVEAEAGSAAHLVVLHTKADAASLTVALGEGAQLELTHLFAAEAFAEVSFYLRASHLQQVANILKDPEATDND